MSQPVPADKRPKCWMCKKPVNLPVRHFQGGVRDLPSYRKCMVVIKRAKDGGI